MGQAKDHKETQNSIKIQIWSELKWKCYEVVHLQFQRIILLLSPKKATECHWGGNWRNIISFCEIDPSRWCILFENIWPDKMSRSVIMQLSATASWELYESVLGIALVDPRAPFEWSYGCTTTRWNTILFSCTNRYRESMKLYYSFAKFNKTSPKPNEAQGKDDREVEESMWQGIWEQLNMTYA